MGVRNPPSVYSQSPMPYGTCAPDENHSGAVSNPGSHMRVRIDIIAGEISSGAVGLLPRPQ